MKAYRVSGIAPFGSVRNKFSLDLPAESKDDAEHVAYSILGSRHKEAIQVKELDTIIPLLRELEQREVALSAERNSTSLSNSPLALRSKEIL